MDAIEAYRASEAAADAAYDVATGDAERVLGAALEAYAEACSPALAVYKEAMRAARAIYEAEKHIRWRSN